MAEARNVNLETWSMWLGVGWGFYFCLLPFLKLLYEWGRKIFMRAQPAFHLAHPLEGSGQLFKHSESQFPHLSLWILITGF